MRLSVVSTLYNSAPFITEFYDRIVAAATTITEDFEIILVNDGSPDNVLELAVELHKSDPRVTIIDLSRNFGHHRAMMAGLMYARGELVFLIDCDLEEDPELLTSFYAAIQREQCDVIYGVQKKRRGNWFEAFSGNAFYWIIVRLGGIDIPKNVTTVRLMSRRYVRNLIRHRERELVIAGLWQATGFRQVACEINKSRLSHPSNYFLLRRLRLAIDYITTFSDNVLYFAFYAGVIISFVSFVFMALFVLRYLVTGSALAGWTSTIASIWMFGGISILLIGLIGIYIARIFTETKRRPYVIVRDIYRAKSLRS